MKSNRHFVSVIAFIMVILASLGCEATSQFFPTSTPTNTLTPTLSPSPTFTPTRTPTITPTPLPDISGAKIFLEDLPEGFEELTPAEFGMNPADLQDENFEPEEIFIYVNSNNFQIIMGFNFFLTDKINRIGFDTSLNNPEIVMGAFLGGMGTDTVRNQEILEGMEDIGENQVAMAMETDLESIAMSIDILIIRRGIVGGMIITMYLEGKKPNIPIRELGLSFDKNIQSTLATAP